MINTKNINTFNIDIEYVLGNNTNIKSKVQVKNKGNNYNKIEDNNYYNLEDNKPSEMK